MLNQLCRQAIAVFSIAIGATMLIAPNARAQDDTIKIGLIVALTGPFADTGKQMEAGARLWMAEHGEKVGGKRVQLIVKDDGGLPEATRRIAQELVVQEKVSVLAGLTLTPLALSVASLATQSKTPTVVMLAATSTILDASPYFVRTSFTLPQVAQGIAEWAPKSGMKKVVTLVSDYGPGIDAENAFRERFTSSGGEVLSSVRVPLRSPDFAPFLQRVRDAKPDAVFVFLPAGVGSQFMKQFSERGLDKAGIKLIGTGEVVGDDILNGMGDVTLGVVTSHHYSAAHPSAMNKKFVADFAKANGGTRASYIAVHSYDGMHVIYNALNKTQGAGGEALLNAMRGQAFESPRGKILIDPKTRDIVQDVYMRRVERREGQLWNMEFDSMKAVKDPVRNKQ